jgi:hypothetical protein
MLPEQRKVKAANLHAGAFFGLGAAHVFSN